MNKLYYFMQVLTIVICSTCALMVAISVLCSCTVTADKNHMPTVDARLYTVTTSKTLSDVVNDTAAAQLAICEQVLNECVKCGVLDAKGVQAYNRLKTQKSVAAYIELIAECEQEENFYDTIGNGDAWCNYVWHVLEPRGLAE